MQINAVFVAVGQHKLHKHEGVKGLTGVSKRPSRWLTRSAGGGGEGWRQAAAVHALHFKEHSIHPKVKAPTLKLTGAS